MFYQWCFFLFYFFLQAASEVPQAQPIAVKLCLHMIAIWERFIMQVQKFGGPSPKKLGAKNMQNSARFQTTSNFYREYLRNGSRYPKSENVLIESNSSRVLRKKSDVFGPIQSIGCEFGPTQIEFSGDYISALMGCCMAPQIFTRTRDWPRLASASLLHLCYTRSNSVPEMGWDEMRWTILLAWGHGDPTILLLIGSWVRDLRSSYDKMRWTVHTT